MALTGISASRLQGKLRDLDGRLSNAEKRQMVAGPMGPKGDKGYSGLQVRIAQLTCRVTHHLETLVRLT